MILYLNKSKNIINSLPYPEGYYKINLGFSNCNNPDYISKDNFVGIIGTFIIFKKCLIKDENDNINITKLTELKANYEDIIYVNCKREWGFIDKNINWILNKMENDKEALKKKISELENELAQLKNLQVALKVILPQIINYFNVEDESKTILFNLSENDFTSDKKISTFIDFSNKIKTQRDLLVGENAIVDNKRIEVSNQITDFQLKIKKLESNIRQFPSEAEEAKRIIQNEFNKRGIKCQVRLFAELVESLNDESWRKSIETFLWNKRFNIIVDDDYCHEALKILIEKNIYKTSVILTDKIPETEIEEKSAASVLNITNKGARRYANYLLNGIHLCENIEELHEYPKGGITKDGMLCKSYAASKNADSEN